MKHLDPIERALKSKLDSFQPDVSPNWNEFSKQLPGKATSLTKWYAYSGAAVVATGVTLGVVLNNEEETKRIPEVELNDQVELVVLTDTSEEAVIATDAEESNRFTAEDTYVVNPATLKAAPSSKALTEDAVKVLENKEEATEKVAKTAVSQETKDLKYHIPAVFCAQKFQELKLDARAENVVWDFGDDLIFGNQVSHAFKHEGKHRVELSYTLEGKQYAKYFEVDVAQAKDVKWSNQVSKTIDNAVLNLEQHSPYHLTWTLNGKEISDEKELELDIKKHGVYEIGLKGTDEYGCPIRKSKEVNINSIYKVVAPEAFTPINQDGLNDEFMPEFSENVVSFVFIISDLKGNVVFESKDRSNPWNGKLRDGRFKVGDYAWALTLKSSNGDLEKHNGKIKVYN